MNTKDYILELINCAISAGTTENEDDSRFDIAALKEIINNIKSNKDYFLEFIIDLTDNDLVKLAKNIDNKEKRKSFLASTTYLKKLIEINKKEDVNIPLSKKQEAILFDLYDLISDTITKCESNEEKDKKSRTKVSNYIELKERLISNKALNIEDYNKIKKLVRAYETGNIGSALNEVMDFLNSYNYDLIAPKEEPKEEIIQPAKEKTIKTKKIKQIKKKPEEHIENKAVEKESSVASEIDIFSPQSFIYNPDIVKEKKSKKKILSDTFNISNSLIELGIKEEMLTDYAKELLNKINDLSLLKNNYYYFLDNLKGRFKTNNINGIISILCLSNEEIVNSLFAYFKELNLSEKAIDSLLNRCTDIFFIENKDKFKKSVNLALKYQANIESLINNNITYFYNTFEYNKNKIKLLEQNGLNINQIFNLKPQLLAIGIDTLINNYQLIKSYGYNLEVIDYDSISIIGSKYLNKMIDLFIESGFSEYMIDKECLKNTRSLIIKRIFYAFKNKLNVWDENVSSNRKNEAFETIINKERYTLTDEEIYHLISEHNILESMVESKRPYMFNDATIAQIKRKYEFKINNNTFSRLKTYSIFKVLINHDIEEKEALFYALTYNSNITDSEYLLLKKEILGSNL